MKTDLYSEISTEIARYLLQFLQEEKARTEISKIIKKFQIKYVNLFEKFNNDEFESIFNPNEFNLLVQNKLGSILEGNFERQAHRVLNIVDDKELMEKILKDPHLLQKTFSKSLHNNSNNAAVANACIEETEAIMNELAKKVYNSPNFSQKSDSTKEAFNNIIQQMEDKKATIFDILNEQDKSFVNDIMDTIHQVQGAFDLSPKTLNALKDFKIVDVPNLPNYHQQGYEKSTNVNSSPQDQDQSDDGR